MYVVVPTYVLYIANVLYLLLLPNNRIIKLVLNYNHHNRHLQIYYYKYVSNTHKKAVGRGIEPRPDH